MESYLSYVGVAGSAMSMLATLYFWLVRVRDERPSLTPYFLDKELFLGMSRGDTRQLGLKVGVVVANDSILPNSILGVRMWVRVRDGWLEVGNVTLDKQTPMPLNLPARQTTLVRVTGTLSFPYQDALEQGSKTEANYANAFLTQPLEFKVEIRHLRDLPETHVITVPAPSPEAATGLRVHSQAA